MLNEKEELARERARRVAFRRHKRRLNALAAVLLSLAAGTFLACQREVKSTARPAPTPKPSSDETSKSLAPQDAGPNSSATDLTREDAGPGGPSDLGSVDVGKSGRVDKHEHRKGMPVRDNLVE
jgi:hypothetical protein